MVLEDNRVELENMKDYYLVAKNVWDFFTELYSPNIAIFQNSRMADQIIRQRENTSAISNRQ